jgi:hypothetical protein
MQQKNKHGVAAAITTRRSRAVTVANTHEDDAQGLPLYTNAFRVAWHMMDSKEVGMMQAYWY